MPKHVYHIAEINIARMLEPLDSPIMAEFANNLDQINALAESSPGFVWRLQTEQGNATDIQPTDDELVKINLSVWESVEALADFVYRSEHTAYLRRRREWFERYATAYTALWWIPAGRLPTIAEALDRLDRIEAVGPTLEAFTFSARFPPPNGDPGVEGLDVETLDTQICG